jgi:hypothetical protein
MGISSWEGPAPGRLELGTEGPRAPHLVAQALHRGPHVGHVLRVDADVLPGGPAEVPAVHHQVGAQEAVGRRLERALAHEPRERGRRPLGVVQLGLDAPAGVVEGRPGVLVDGRHVAQVLAHEAEEHPGGVDHVAHDVAGLPVLAGRLRLPAVLGHGGHGGGEGVGQAAVAVGDGAHGL